MVSASAYRGLRGLVSRSVSSPYSNLTCFLGAAAEDTDALATIARFDFTADGSTNACSLFESDGVEGATEGGTTGGDWGYGSFPDTAYGYHRFTCRDNTTRAVVIVERELSAGEVATLRTYLNTKAGL